MISPFVMPGLVPGIPLGRVCASISEMAGHQGDYARLRGLCPAMTREGV
jgi:hypothetical protein